MREGRITAPSELRAWELDLDGDRYVLFEWDAAAPTELPLLTAAERDVLGRMIRGQTNAAIAVGRRSSPRTVANQIASLYRKLGVRSRAELVARVSRVGA